jgi:hypothetical protein
MNFLKFVLDIYVFTFNVGHTMTWINFKYPI